MSDFEKRNEWEKEPLQEKQLNLSEDDFSEKKQEPENEEEATIKEEMDTPQEEQPMLPTDDSEQISPDKEEIEEIKATEQAVASSSEEGRAFNNQKGNSKAKGFFSLLAAGIFGSALTFFTIPHTDLYNDSYDKLEKQVAELSNKVESKTGAITASTTSNTATSDGTVAIADMVETSSKAIVGIENLQQQQSNPFSQESSDVESGSGSGIIFKKDDQYAYIVTNNHVIEGANTLEISLYNGEKTEAKLIGADALTDLAVVRIDAKYATDVINFGDSSTLRPGDQVWAIGNPLGLELSRTVTQGIVSAVERSITVNTSAGDWEFNVIQTDAAINPGNSGGALINSSGEVIGINSLKIADSGVEGLGFAIPSNDLIPIVNEIIEKGKVERPYLGVGLASLEEVPRMYLQDLPNEVSEGVMVTNIDSNSAAAEAGLKVQDVIVSIDGKKITNSTDLRKYLYTEVKIGDKVELEIYRDGKSQKVELTLTSNNTNN
ncbi:trypsin-like peptidase domain-containing protein [Cytobacillus oceanisediminis]|uniref:S1C family serine protease n=1 Tax=Bacillaceae TaxID=186817 RepID=UPI00197B14DA|nr:MULTISPECIES: trypsin-like peptidase domain-containing protein [Bacillaceae]MBZ9537145.1 trypsin-like peptidase domain-containing protein [Cytobacillus oceanisediminis]UTI43665.1 trypsin-like peptidase domain-containing protein [Niallia sp. RD1]